MKKIKFYWFILVYALIVVYDGFYGYIHTNKNEIIIDAVVSRLDKNENPILVFEFSEQNFTYKDKFANKYMFVKVGEKVKIKFRINEEEHYLTNIEIIDFKYQLLSMDKFIFHILILFVSFLGIRKFNYQY